MDKVFVRPPKIHSTTFTSSGCSTPSSRSFPVDLKDNQQVLFAKSQIALPYDNSEGGFVNDRLRCAATPTDQSQNVGKDVTESSLDLDGLLVDQAIYNFMTLPEALNEVISMQKGQGDEIHKQELVLAFVEEQISKAKEKNIKVKEEIASTERQILLVEEDRCKVERSCKDIQSVMRSIVSEINILKFNEEQLAKEVDEETRGLAECRDKMREHMTAVHWFEDSLDLFSSLHKLEQEVQELKNQDVWMRTQTEVQRIMSGEMIREQQEYVLDLQEKAAQLVEHRKTTELQIQEEKTHHAVLDQSIQVLQKRNSAQVMRLKRQLKEVSCRNRRWTDQIHSLQESINQLKWKISQ